MEAPSEQKGKSALAALPALAMRERGSESFRVGQEKSPACRGIFLGLFVRLRSFVEVPSNEKVAALLAALPAHAMRGRGSESFRVGQKGVLRIAGYAFLKCP